MIKRNEDSQTGKERKRESERERTPSERQQERGRERGTDKNTLREIAVKCDRNRPRQSD